MVRCTLDDLRSAKVQKHYLLSILITAEVL